MAADQHRIPQTLEEIIKDFEGRRSGLIKAIVHDDELLYQLCGTVNINSKQAVPVTDHLSLYGLPCGTWELSHPIEDAPPQLPEPITGINAARLGTQKKLWFSLVAAHSDAWLVSVAFYYGSKLGFGKSQRNQLFNKINNLPTVLEMLNLSAKDPQKEKSSKKKCSTSKAQENEEADIVCGLCKKRDTADGFWICCDTCNTWFHGLCVGITAEKAKHINKYKCPGCSKKRGRA